MSWAEGPVQKLPNGAFDRLLPITSFDWPNPPL